MLTSRTSTLQASRSRSSPHKRRYWIAHILPAAGTRPVPVLQPRQRSPASCLVLARAPRPSCGPGTDAGADW